MKATELLKEDHSRVSRLFKKVKDTPPREHPAIFGQIKAELDVHAHIEEIVFYPVLLKKGKKDLQAITREGLEEHAQAKLLLADLAGTTRLNKQYEAKLKVLMEDIEHHVKEEEDEMFPMVEDQMTAAALEKMGDAMELEKAKFIKRMTPDEQTALEWSLAEADEKGPIGEMYEKAKGMVAGMFAAGKDKANGKTAAAARARKADKPSKIPETRAEKRRAAVDGAIRKTHVARASK